MRRLYLKCAIIICLCGLFSGCTSEKHTEDMEVEVMEENDMIEEQDMIEKDYRALDDKEYLIEVYGVPAEELEGIDIEWLDQKAHFRDSKMSADRVREWIEAEKPYASEDNKNTFLLLTAEPNISIPQGTIVKKIGFYYNPDTFVQRSVFDNDKKVFCVDDDKEYQLDVDLTGVVDKYKVYEWDTENISHKEGSSGSYGWKLVFEAEDGHKYVYQGFTQDGSMIPDGYVELSKQLIEIIKNRK